MSSPRAGLAIVAACATLTACEVPTEAPIIEQRWQIPVEEISLAVDEILPDGVTVAGSSFDVDVDPVSASQTLGNLCPACAPLNGLTAPVPPFSGNFTASQPLPSNVVSASVTGGSIAIQITNTLGFDPIALGGTVVIEVRNGPGGAVLGMLNVAGPIPTGSTVNRTLTLGGGTLNAPLTATTAVTVTNPSAQTAVINTAGQISAVGTVSSVLVSQVVANVPSQSVTFDPVDLDVEDLDADLTDRIQQGTIILDIQNPFAVSFSGNAVIGSVSKSFTVAGSGPSTQTLSYTGDELRSFLGQPNIVFSGSGTASGTAVTITPGQELMIEATLDMTIQIGG